MGVEAHEGSRVPEGQAIHRLARIVSGFLAGRVVAASSPQGRFAEGAARLDGLTAFHAQAWGKHFFMPFAESRTPTAEPLLGDDGPAWLHVHLGLYGRWSFSGPRATDVAGAGLRGGGNAAAVPEPGATVRLRLEAEDLAADLTGPARCEAFDGQGVRAVLARLGPDPVRNEPGDRERFVTTIRSRRAAVGQLILDQSIAAGPGNIYRADCLFRTGISPLTPGGEVSPERLGALWDDLAATMADDVDSGVIRTVPPDLRPEPVPEGDEEAGRFAVYHRTGRPCLRCGTTIVEKDLVGRRLFWCPGCQR